MPLHGENKYKCGQEITINAEVSEGYIWTNWTNGENEITEKEYTFEMPAKNTIYTANAEPSTRTRYTVKHWQQNIRGNANFQDNKNYTLIETENTLTGTTGETVTPETKTYEGFTAPETQELEILADGTAEINYYYTRNSYQLTLNKGTGIENVSVGAGLASARRKYIPIWTNHNNKRRTNGKHGTIHIWLGQMDNRRTIQTKR